MTAYIALCFLFVSLTHSAFTLYPLYIHQGATSISLHKDLNVLSNDDAISVYGYYGSCEGSTAGCVGGSDTDTLETAAINYMPSNECDDIYGRHVTGPHDFCVKDDVRSDGLQGVCMGDSGQYCSILPL